MRVNQNILFRNWIKFQKKDKSRISPSFFFITPMFSKRNAEQSKNFSNLKTFLLLHSSCFIILFHSNKGISLSLTLSLQKLCSNSFTLFSPSQLSEKRKTKSKCTPPHKTSPSSKIVFILPTEKRHKVFTVSAEIKNPFL